MRGRDTAVGLVWVLTIGCVGTLGPLGSVDGGVGGGGTASAGGAASGGGAATGGGSASGGGTAAGGGSAGGGGVALPDAGPPTDQPAWLADAGLNEWVEIPGTALTSGALPVFGGFAVRPQDSTLVIAAAGGHSDSSDNSVVAIRLAQDLPTWTTLQPASTSPDQNPVATWGYNHDGLPGAMHLYHSLQYIPALDAVLRLNPRYTWPGAMDLDQAPKGFNDAFSLATRQWAGRGVHPVSPAGLSDYALCTDAEGRVWTSTRHRYDAAAKAWAAPITSTTSASVRFPGAYDSKRRQVFMMQWGDSQGAGSGWSASRIPVDGTAQFDVTLTGAALATLSADLPQYPGLAYDPINDEFLFISGGSWTGSSASLIPNQDVFVITPNDTNSWAISRRTYGGAAWTCRGDGVNARFAYLPQFKGFVFQPNSAKNLLFLRTAP